MRTECQIQAGSSIGGHEEIKKTSRTHPAPLFSHGSDLLHRRKAASLWFWRTLSVAGLLARARLSPKYTALSPSRRSETSLTLLKEKRQIIRPAHHTPMVTTLAS